MWAPWAPVVKGSQEAAFQVCTGVRRGSPGRRCFLHSPCQGSHSSWSKALTLRHDGGG